MAIKSNVEFKGVSLTDAYIKAIVSLDVSIYKDESQRKSNSPLGNMSISISDSSMAKIYEIIKTEAFNGATDELTNSWESL